MLRNAAALNANQTMALVDRHNTVSAPTIIIWGMDDPWQKAEDARQLASEIPNAIFRPLEGVSHWIQQDAPQEFVEAVIEFLSGG